jgi:hypothetical protein
MFSQTYFTRKALLFYISFGEGIDCREEYPETQGAIAFIFLVHLGGQSSSTAYASPSPGQGGRVMATALSVAGPGVNTNCAVSPVPPMFSE